MGGIWKAKDYVSYASYSATAASTRDFKEVFKQKAISSYLNPRTFKIRECRNSVEIPVSTPIIVALDVSGSMGKIAHEIAKTGLGEIAKNIFDTQIIPGPQLMFMGIGDVEYDHSPLQATQFEGDDRIIQQLNQLYVECGGGFNECESYNLAWYFADQKTSADAFEKDNRKGVLITIGDEMPPLDLTDDQIRNVFGDGQMYARDNNTLLNNLLKKYHVYHLMIEQGNFMLRNTAKVQKAWTNILGQNAVTVPDFQEIGTYISDIIKTVAKSENETLTSKTSPSPDPTVSSEKDYAVFDEGNQPELPGI